MKHLIPKNEEFVKIHEDPLYIILKEEKKQRKEIEQNPYKMKQILNDLNHDKEKNSNRRPIIEIVHVIVGDDSNEEIKKNFNDPAFEFIRKNTIKR